MTARIQSAWRGHRTRKWIRFCRTRLPDDAWRIVLYFLSGQDEIDRRHRVIRRLCTLRILRLRFGPPTRMILLQQSSEATRRLLSTMRLMQHYLSIVDPETVKCAVHLAIHLVHLNSHPLTRLQCAVIDAFLAAGSDQGGGWSRNTKEGGGRSCARTRP